MLCCCCQLSIDKLSCELQAEQDKARSLHEAECKAKAAEERLQIQLKHKADALSDLEAKFKVVKQEADSHIQTAVSTCMCCSFLKELISES